MPARYDIQPYKELLDSAADLYTAVRVQRIAGARQLLDDALDLLLQDLPTIRARYERLLRRYRGVPASPNPLAILQVEGDEIRTTMLLRWLLDPKEDHGLKDDLLRIVLAQLRSETARRLAVQPDPLQVAVLKEVEFRHGIPDLVLVHRDLVLVGEVKVQDQVHLNKLKGMPDPDGMDRKEVPQTRAYRMDLEEHGAQLRTTTLARLRKLSGLDLPRQWNPDGAFLFIAPEENISPGDAEYDQLTFGQLVDGLSRLREIEALRPDQVAMLDAVRTGLLTACVSKSENLVDLLGEIRRVGLTLGPGVRGGRVVKARQLLDEWSSLINREGMRCPTKRAN